jgi:3-methyladenine DNA glycosylase/8-oxoguanine DNA glycosylase
MQCGIPSQISDGNDETLHELGGELYLHRLQSISYPIVVREQLLQFFGVGRKVADCIALFA